MNTKKGIPSKIWAQWVKLTRMIADIMARGVMTIFYFTIAIPFGLGVRFLRDPLNLKPSKPHWILRKKPGETVEDARRMY